MILCMIFGMLVGCNSAPKEQPEMEQYVLDCGITLTAAAGMQETKMDGFTAVLQGEETIIFLLEENKSTLNLIDLSLEEYARLIKNGNQLKEDFILVNNGTPTLEYTREVDGETYYYYATVHESKTSFWFCQMACKETERDRYQMKFVQWSSSLRTKDTEFVLPDITEKTYTLDCGLQFTGPDGMRPVMQEGFVAYLTDNYMAISFLAEEKPKGWALKDYAKAAASANIFGPLKANEHGVLAVEYTWESLEGVNYWYYVTVFETEEYFWMVQFMGLESMKERYESYLPAWSASIKSVS